MVKKDTLEATIPETKQGLELYIKMMKNQTDRKEKDLKRDYRLLKFANERMEVFTKSDGR